MKLPERRHYLQIVSNRELVRDKFREQAARLYSNAEDKRLLTWQGTNAVGPPNLSAVDVDLYWKVLTGQEVVFAFDLIRYLQGNTHGIGCFLFDTVYF